MGLVNSGIDEMALLTTGTGGTAFNNTNTRIGVGNGNAVFSEAHTDLQGASKFRKVVTASTGGPNTPTGTSGAKTVTYSAVFNSGEAEFAWEEWGIFNSATANVGMLCRAAQVMGTKGAGQVWTVTATLTFGAN